MNPITRAMQRFIEDAEAFWRARPHDLLPLVAEEGARGDVVQAFRLHEFVPENRRPLIVFDAPFEGAAVYFAGLSEAIASHYESVRLGVAEEGVELPPFRDAEDDGTMPSGALKRAALAMDRMARLLGRRFDGIVVVLVPDRVADAEGWRENVRVMSGTRWSRRVRVAVLAPPDGPLAAVLGSEGVRFAIDPVALERYLEQLTYRASGAPPADAEREGSTEEPRDQAGDESRDEAPEEEPRETSTGAGVDRHPPASFARATLPTLLAQAAAEMRAERVWQAADLYSRARELCEAQGLAQQEATVLLALGGVCSAVSAYELGAEHCGDAAKIAERLEAWPLAAQAWLASGGARLPAGDYVGAAVSYRAAAEAAKRAGIAPLRIEALRMAGSCLVLLEREEDALRVWNEAVEVGAGADVAERRASTFREVGTALIELLEQRGFERQALHVRMLLSRASGDTPT